jgi:hypothetical protein
MHEHNARERSGDCVLERQRYSFGVISKLSANWGRRRAFSWLFFSVYLPQKKFMVDHHAFMRVRY